MKKQLNFKNFSLLIFFWLTSVLAFGQNYDTSKSLNKNATVPGNVRIEISNQSGDIKINTTSSNNVSINTLVEIRGDSKEDVDKVLKAIDDFTFELRGNDMEIDTRFYKMMNSTNNRMTITLLNGDKVKIGELKITHELNIPKTASLSLNNKYSDIELQSLDGEAKFNLYSSNLHAQDFGNEVSLEAKYSKIYLGDILKDVDINFYDSNMEFGAFGDTKINSKYSKFEGEKTQELVIDSYDDKFYIDEATNLTFTAKYTDFVSKAELNEMKLDMYDCNIQTKSAKTATYHGKYSELKLGNVKSFSVSECYDDNFYFGKTVSIQIAESKYSRFEMQETSLFRLSGYDDNVLINKLTSGFSGINVTGKYQKLEINAGSEPFQLNLNIKYPKIDIPESLKVTKRVNENSSLELIAGDKGGKISVEGYDMKVVVKD